MAELNQQSVIAMMSKDEKGYFKALGARVAERRKELGLTQVQLAEALGILQQTYASYEVGRYRFPVSMLTPLARMLKIEVDVLLGETTKAHSKRGPVPKLQRHIERISQLPRGDQEALMRTIDAFLSKAV
jgi:transcriptional regulator with XRE-family HTH domain